jgi:hypothetical protein
LVWLIASCQLLAARFSKTIHRTIFRSGANPQLYHLFAVQSREKSVAVVDQLDFHSCKDRFVIGNHFGLVNPERRARPAKANLPILSP